MAVTLYVAGGSFLLADIHSADAVHEQLNTVPGGRTFFYLANGGNLRIHITPETQWAIEETP